MQQIDPMIQNIVKFLKEQFLIERTQEELLEFCKRDFEPLRHISSVNARLTLMAMQIIATPPNETIKPIVDESIRLMESSIAQIDSLSDPEIAKALRDLNTKHLASLKLTAVSLA